MRKLSILILACAFAETAFAETPVAPIAVAAPTAAAAAPVPADAPVKRYNVYKENAKGQAALAAKDFKTAIKIFTETLDSGKLADNWIAPTLFFRGKAYRLSRQSDKALVDYEAAVAKDAKLDIAWYEMALVYRNKDNYPKTVDSYSKAIDLKPGNHLYWYGRCEVRLFINKLKEAESDCKKALEIKSGYVPALSSLGRVYEDSKQKAKAIETYKQVLVLDPGNKDAKDGLNFLSGN